MGPMYRLKEDTASQSSTFNRFKIRSFSRALKKRCSGSPKDLERKFHLNSTGRHRPRFPSVAEKVSPDTWRATGFRWEQRDTNRVTASLLLRNWGESLGPSTRLGSLEEEFSHQRPEFSPIRMEMEVFNL